MSDNREFDEMMREAMAPWVSQESDPFSRCIILQDCLSDVTAIQHSLCANWQGTDYALATYKNRLMLTEWYSEEIDEDGFRIAVRQTMNVPLLLRILVGHFEVFRVVEDSFGLTRVPSIPDRLLLSTVCTYSKWPNIPESAFGPGKYQRRVVVVEPEIEYEDRFR